LLYYIQQTKKIAKITIAIHSVFLPMNDTTHFATSNTAQRMMIANAKFTKSVIIVFVLLLLLVLLLHYKGTSFLNPPNNFQTFLNIWLIFYAIAT